MSVHVWASPGAAAGGCQVTVRREYALPACGGPPGKSLGGTATPSACRTAKNQSSGTGPDDICQRGSSSIAGSWSRGDRLGPWPMPAGRGGTPLGQVTYQGRMVTALTDRPGWYPDTCHMSWVPWPW